MIQVIPGHVELLGPELTYTKRIQGHGFKAKAEFKEVELFFRQPDGSLLAPAGLTARISEFLRLHGYTIRYEDLRTRRLPEPVYENLLPLREKQDEVLAAVLTSDCGIVEVPTGGGKSFMIRQLCMLFPKSRIIIACYSKDIVLQFYAELKEILPPDQIGMVGGGRRETDRRVICCVDRSLMACDLDNVDIFIYDEVHRAAAEQTKQVIARAWNARMWGFSASPTGRSDKADLETEAMFGPVVARLTYQEVQQTGSIVPIVAFQVSTEHLEKINYEMPTAINRHGLWRHDGRNLLIKQMIDWVEQYFGKDQQILISTNKLEHAVFLGAYLPEFTLVYGNMDPEKKTRWEKMKLIPEGVHPLTSKKREEYRQAFRAGTLRRVIATGVWSTGVDFPHLNVLIRADGTAGTIDSTQIPGRASRSSDGKEFGILIDFDDVHHKTLENRAKLRFRHYRKKGWSIQEIRPMTTAELFQGVQATK